MKFGSSECLLTNCLTMIQYLQEFCDIHIHIYKRLCKESESCQIQKKLLCDICNYPDGIFTT